MKFPRGGELHPAPTPEHAKEARTPPPLITSCMTFHPLHFVHIIVINITQVSQLPSKEVRLDHLSRQGSHCHGMWTALQRPRLFTHSLSLRSRRRPIEPDVVPSSKRTEMVMRRRRRASRQNVIQVWRGCRARSRHAKPEPWHVLSCAPNASLSLKTQMPVKIEGTSVKIGSYCFTNGTRPESIGRYGRGVLNSMENANNCLKLPVPSTVKRRVGIQHLVYAHHYERCPSAASLQA